MNLNDFSILWKSINRENTVLITMSRSRIFSQPIQTRMSLVDFQKFEELRQKEMLTTGELARRLLSRGLAEVKFDV